MYLCQRLWSFRILMASMIIGEVKKSCLIVNNLHEVVYRGSRENKTLDLKLRLFSCFLWQRRLFRVCFFGWCELSVQMWKNPSKKDEEAWRRQTPNVGLRLCICFLFYFFKLKNKTINNSMWKASGQVCLLDISYNITCRLPMK